MLEQDFNENQVKLIEQTTRQAKALVRLNQKDKALAEIEKLSQMAKDLAIYTTVLENDLGEESSLASEYRTICVMTRQHEFVR